MRNISKVCHLYDWRHVDENGELLLEIIKENYWINSKWSAYHFMYLKGPNPYLMFFSFKRLALENFYEQEIIQKVKQKVINR